MKEIIYELNQEKCPVHQKNPKCMAGTDGFEYNACCKDHIVMLNLRLREINSRRIAAQAASC